MDEDIVQTEASPPRLRNRRSAACTGYLSAPMVFGRDGACCCSSCFMSDFCFLIGSGVAAVSSPGSPYDSPALEAGVDYRSRAIPTLPFWPRRSWHLIERRPLLAYGYQGTARAVRFISGLVWGFVALSALVLVLWKARLLAFDGELLHGAAILKYALGWGLLFLMVAVFEESTLRGYLQFTLTRGIGFWWGALLLSLLFGFSHGTNPGETPVGLFAAAAVGLVFCLSLWYTGSLWWALGFHASWDWAESYFYGTSDSGLVAQGHLFGEHPTGPAAVERRHDRPRRQPAGAWRCSSSWPC